MVRLSDSDTRWLKKCVRSKLCGSSFEDAWQEIQPVILASEKKFDPSICDSFKAYVWSNVKRALIDFRRKEPLVTVSREGFKKGDRAPAMKDIDGPSTPSHYRTWSDLLPDQSVQDPSILLDKKRTLAYLLSALDTHERYTIERLIVGDTLRGIAGQLGLTFQRVQQISVQATEKIHYERASWEKIRPRQIAMGPLV